MSHGAVQSVGNVKSGLGYDEVPECVSERCINDHALPDTFPNSTPSRDFMRSRSTEPSERVDGSLRGHPSNCQRTQAC